MKFVTDKFLLSSVQFYCKSGDCSSLWMLTRPCTLESYHYSSRLWRNSVDLSAQIPSGERRRRRGTWWRVSVPGSGRDTVSRYFSLTFPAGGCGACRPGRCSLELQVSCWDDTPQRFYRQDSLLWSVSPGDLTKKSPSFANFNFSLIPLRFWCQDPSNFEQKS